MPLDCTARTMMVKPRALRRVERREHAPGFTAWAIREMYRGWLSVPVPSAPPGAGGSVWGFWLEQTHADESSVVIDALDDVSV